MGVMISNQMKKNKASILCLEYIEYSKSIYRSTRNLMSFYISFSFMFGMTISIYSICNFFNRISAQAWSNLGCCNLVFMEIRESSKKKNQNSALGNNLCCYMFFLPALEILYILLSLYQFFDSFFMFFPIKASNLLVLYLIIQGNWCSNG